MNRGEEISLAAGGVRKVGVFLRVWQTDSKRTSQSGFALSEK